MTMALIILANVGFILYTLTCLVDRFLASHFRSLITNIPKAILTLIGRTIYFFFFHPLAKFPGPSLAKVGDVYWYYALLSGGGHRMNYDWHKRYGWFASLCVIRSH